MNSTNMSEHLKAYADEETEPDEWDLQMIERARKENDGHGAPIEVLADELDIT